MQIEKKGPPESKHKKQQRRLRRHLPSWILCLITCCAEPVIKLPSAQDSKLGVGQRAATKSNLSVRDSSATISLIPFSLSVAGFCQTDASVTIPAHQAEVSLIHNCIHVMIGWEYLAQFPCKFFSKPRVLFHLLKNGRTQRSTTGDA